MDMKSEKKIGVIGIDKGWSTGKLLESIENRTGFRCLIEMQSIRFDVGRGRVYHDDIDLSDLDALVVKKIGSSYNPYNLDRLEILRYLSEQGVPIFSKPENIKKAIDRLSCTTTLRLGNIPLPPTVITEDDTEAIEAIKRFGVAVLKPLYTSKARGMMVVSADEAVEAVGKFHEAGNSLYYIQKKLNLPGRDLGLIFLGGKYLGTYARVANGDSWNTTIRAGGKYQPYDPDDDIIKLAQRAQALFDLDFTSVDVAETDDGPVVFEVSAFGGFRGLQESRQINAADLYVDYVLKEIAK
ncbi:MAG: GAK system ATP-grasp enzyme [candidate division Zixibacteria bacterium]|nr:GAK system ATP-grasp enzyme [candidate division Zixibacteria bacterium]